MILLALTLSCYGGAPPPIPLDPVRFLSINDVQLPDTLPNGLGGLARVATVRQRLADQGPILFVLAGNALGSDAKRMVDLLNRAHLDFATFGIEAEHAIVRTGPIPVCGFVPVVVNIAGAVVERQCNGACDDGRFAERKHRTRVTARGAK